MAQRCKLSDWRRTWYCNINSASKRSSTPNLYWVFIQRFPVSIQKILLNKENRYNSKTCVLQLGSPKLRTCNALDNVKSETNMLSCQRINIPRIRWSSLCNFYTKGLIWLWIWNEQKEHLLFANEKRHHWSVRGVLQPPMYISNPCQCLLLRSLHNKKGLEKGWINFPSWLSFDESQVSLWLPR